MPVPHIANTASTSPRVHTKDPPRLASQPSLGRSVMDPMAGLPRNASVEELALSMFGAGAAGFRLGRTPSEAEFTQFLSAGGLAPGGDGDMPGGACTGWPASTCCPPRSAIRT